VQSVEVASRRGVEPLLPP